MNILKKLIQFKQWINSTSIYKYGIPTLIDNTDEDPCDSCKYKIGENKKICDFCIKHLKLNQYYR